MQKPGFSRPNICSSQATITRSGVMLSWIFMGSLHAQMAGEAPYAAARLPCRLMLQARWQGALRQPMPRLPENAQQGTAFRGGHGCSFAVFRNTNLAWLLLMYGQNLVRIVTTPSTTSVTVPAVPPAITASPTLISSWEVMSTSIVPHGCAASAAAPTARLHHTAYGGGPLAPARMWRSRG